MKLEYDYDIVIVDSGVSIDTSECALFDYYDITSEYTFRKSLEYRDDIGHGTAIYRIISNETENARICVVRVFCAEHKTDEAALIRALSFIYENISCKIINLSLGIVTGDSLDDIEEICRKLSDKRTIIVSAFDNGGSISYPAAYDCVIGVDNWYQCRSVDSFEYVSSGPVNIRAKGGLQKVDWNNKSTVMGGGSFACAHITALIFRLISSEYRQPSMNEVLGMLESNAVHVYRNYTAPLAPSPKFDIHRVALFPFNKEMHQIVRFSSELPFEITAVYDLAQTGRVGMNTNRLVVKSEIDSGVEYIIKNINKITYDDFDTLILGHMDEINRIAGCDIRSRVMCEALENGKNIYSFDPVDTFNTANYVDKVYHPQINPECTYNNFGKLYQTNKPIVCICGTSSAQGKFTLQVILRKFLISEGYSVGQIGTEPHSLLFGMDYAMPIGYASDIELNDWQMIAVLNRMVAELSKRDIIIAGSQANSIPLTMNNLSAVPVRMNSFLLGINPDLVILTINPDDDTEYIRNTIKYIEGVVGCRVIALVMFPMVSVEGWKSTFDMKRAVGDEEFERVRSNVSFCTGLPVYELGDISQMKELYRLIIDNLT